MVSRTEYDRWKDELGLIWTFEQLNAPLLDDIAMDEIGSMAMAQMFEARRKRREELAKEGKHPNDE